MCKPQNSERPPLPANKQRLLHRQVPAQLVRCSLPSWRTREDQSPGPASPDSIRATGAAASQNSLSQAPVLHVLSTVLLGTHTTSRGVPSPYRNEHAIQLVLYMCVAAGLQLECTKTPDVYSFPKFNLEILGTKEGIKSVKISLVSMTTFSP